MASLNFFRFVFAFLLVGLNIFFIAQVNTKFVNHQQYFIITPGVPLPVNIGIPTATVAPQPSPTPLGGGGGSLLIHYRTDWDDENWDFFTLDLQTKWIGLLKQNEEINKFPTWSPDGKFLLFTTHMEQISVVKLLNIESGEILEILSLEGMVNNITYSNNGRNLLYTKRFKGNLEVFMYDLFTEVEKRVSDSPGDDFKPVLSPDGRQIIFITNVLETKYFYVFDIETEVVKRLTSNAWKRWTDIFWDADSNSIFYRAEQDKVESIRRLYIESGEDVALFTTTDYIRNFELSPDGDWLLFDWQADDYNYIYKMNVDGEELQSLIESDINAKYPLWSPDSNWISYKATDETGWHIYLMKADGSEITKLTYGGIVGIVWGWQPARIDICLWHTGECEEN